MEKRKYPRLKTYDYSNPGAYFITICTDNRRSILSRIAVGRGLAPTVPARPELTEIGKIALSELLELEKRFPNLTIENHVIMPNHIHILMRLEKAGASPHPTIPGIIGAYKSIVTWRVNETQNTAGQKLFQTSFHDHVIRDEHDYLTRWQYIDDNPAKWSEDQYYA